MIEPNRESHGAARPTSAPWTDRETCRVAELWETGMTASAIGRVLGKSRNSVLGKIGRMRLKHGNVSGRGARGAGGSWAHPVLPVARHRRFAWSKEHLLRLVRLWNEGLATDEIAARLGCAETLVVEQAAFAGLAPFEAPERHSSVRWFARNDARFRAAMQWAVERGLVSLPNDDAGASPPAGVAARGPADGE